MFILWRQFKLGVNPIPTSVLVLACTFDVSQILNLYQIFLLINTWMLY